MIRTQGSGFTFLIVMDVFIIDNRSSLTIWKKVYFQLKTLITHFHSNVVVLLVASKTSNNVKTIPKYKLCIAVFFLLYRLKIPQNEACWELFLF